ncbi:hypothetical protein B0H63DRAFT_108541 [Podospora didyma]|uniref:HTH APSES-type domain-containing protein n=1 Tax=Podospora didyma TaxID=330526 RepID=A0AAE0NYU2_9PEZI|nr:hypothetical protein B0H63DRAFT_108541 [Podospora didyma]
MLSLSSLLNPDPPREPHRVPLPGSRPPLEPSSSGVPSLAELAVRNRHLAHGQDLLKESKDFAKSKVKGVVNFLPFEDLNEESRREARRFQVRPFGAIVDNCRRIPYHSGKKDFFEKTGRDSFEVFHYDFQIPLDIKAMIHKDVKIPVGDMKKQKEDTYHTVMWDYNVGLVRMTPFFKCLEYSKTTPAKMLNLNRGLRDITHSITGGSIKAQGYWMPFDCARAVCATFCHPIAGALIPLFGPNFPLECIPYGTSNYAHMVIDKEIVLRSTRQAEAFLNSNIVQGPLLALRLSSRSSSPKEPQYSESYRAGSNLPSWFERRDLDMESSSYATGPDTDFDGRVLPLRHISTAPTSAGTIHSPGWTPVTHASPTWTTINRPSPAQQHRYLQQNVSQFQSPNREQYFGGSVASHEVPNPLLTAIPGSSGSGYCTARHQQHGSYYRHNRPAPLPLPPPVPYTTSGLHTRSSSSSTSSPGIQAGVPHQREHRHSKKRSFAKYETLDEDAEYDAGASQSDNSPTTTAAMPPDSAGSHIAALVPPLLPKEPITTTMCPRGGSASAGSGAESDAALMLLRLRGRDTSVPPQSKNGEDSKDEGQEIEQGRLFSKENGNYSTGGSSGSCRNSTTRSPSPSAPDAAANASSASSVPVFEQHDTDDFCRRSRRIKRRRASMM